MDTHIYDIYLYSQDKSTEVYWCIKTMMIFTLLAIKNTCGKDLNGDAKRTTIKTPVLSFSYFIIWPSQIFHLFLKPLDTKVPNTVDVDSLCRVENLF